MLTASFFYESRVSLSLLEFHCFVYLHYITSLIKFSLKNFAIALAVGVLTFKKKLSYYCPYAELKITEEMYPVKLTGQLHFSSVKISLVLTFSKYTWLTGIMYS